MTNMKIRSGIFSKQPLHDYHLIRVDGKAIPKKDIDLYEAAPQLYAALDYILKIIPSDRHTDIADCMLVLEQALGGKKTDKFKTMTMLERYPVDADE